MSGSDEDDFAALFAASEQAQQFGRGQTVEGTIVGIGAEVAFVDIGGKGEAVVDVKELRNDQGELDVKEGDRIQAVVVSTSGGVTLSRRLARGAATDRQLADAYASGLAVEGRVEREVKGGFEVRIGKSRAFCPISQIDIVRTLDPAPHIGRVYTFRILEYRNDGRDLVVSRRALLEAEQEAEADEVRRAAVPGAVLRGRVASVRDYGAFVDLGGGVQGLVHASDLGWSRVTDITQNVSVGEEITVKVLRVDEASGKIALGTKQLSEDPWSTVGLRYEAGQIHSGRVTRHAQFGAFIELEPGIEALAHASTFAAPGRRDDWRKAVPVGTMARFEIVSVDLPKHRIGVAPVDERAAGSGPAQDTDDVREYQARAEADASRATGTMADKLRDALGARRQR